MVSLFENDQQRLSRLAREMQEGNSRSAGELYDYLMPKVFGFCLTRLKNRAQAEDVTQDIFLKLIEKIETFNEEKGNFLSWFWQVARNTLIDTYRERKNTSIGDTENDPTLNIPDEDNLEQTIDTKRDLEDLRAFLKQLSAEEQELFELRFIAELSYEEMTQVTQKSSGALRVAVNRLKTKIQTGLQR